jgi:uncharacterized protein YeeX (DUF496 family)
VHEWLSANGIALVQNINKHANNITREIAVLKPTQFLIVNNDNLLKYLQTLNATEINVYLATLTKDWQDLIDDYQSDFNSLSLQARSTLYFTSPVDIESLKNYIKQIIRGSTLMSRLHQENAVVQAEYVLRLAQSNNGLLHQKIDKKAFGRTYYEGVSVLSTTKDGLHKSPN